MSRIAVIVAAGMIVCGCEKSPRERQRLDHGRDWVRAREECLDYAASVATAEVCPSDSHVGSVHAAADEPATLLCRCIRDGGTK